MLDAIVIGGGLFGQIIHKQLKFLGMDSVILDSWMRNETGSDPAACLMKPSWFSSLGSDVYEPSLSLLDELYGVEDIRFRVGPTHATVHWCNPREILKPETVRMEVTEVGPGWMRSDRERFEARAIIVAAGVWTSSLVHVPGLSGRKGAAFLWPGHSLREPFIHPYAPYRQLVVFNRGDGIWAGDGTAVKDLTPERLEKSRQRCLQAVHKAFPETAKSEPKVLIGTRPYVPKAKPCYLKMEPGLIVATGGAKNGTLAAGWCAHKIGEFLS